VIDGRGVAIYVADITYRSEVIKLHIDLLANTGAARAARTGAKSREAALTASPR
jgi:PHD/YefM family antitoxin component YafN of YafNO toxin-antitoxin module